MRDSVRREAVIVGVGALSLALLARYAWLPYAWEALLQDAATTWNLPVTEVGRWFSAWALGDGQAYAVIASDPLGLEMGSKLGQPAYRYGRAGFGWLAWVASLGQREWVPYGMAMVGMLTLVALFVLAVKMRPVLGPRAWLLILNPAVFISFAGDTTEGLAIFALALAISSGAWWAAAMVGITRPDYLIALVGRRRTLVWGVGTAVVFAMVWTARFGLDVDQFGGRLGWPVVGFIEVPSMQSLALGLLAVTTLIVGIRRRDWGWVSSGLFVLCFTHLVVESAANGWRAGGMLLVLWAFGPGYVAEGPVAVRSAGLVPRGRT
jgi:hypothetical protein